MDKSECTTRAKNIHLVPTLQDGSYTGQYSTFDVNLFTSLKFNALPSGIGGTEWFARVKQVWGEIMCIYLVPGKIVFFSKNAQSAGWRATVPPMNVVLPNSDVSIPQVFHVITLSFSNFPPKFQHAIIVRVSACLQSAKRLWLLRNFCQQSAIKTGRDCVQCILIYSPLSFGYVINCSSAWITLTGPIVIDRWNS